VIVLGFDTATPATALALRLADGSILAARDDPPPSERPGHSTQLLTLADGLLARAGLDWGDLQLVAVGVGPGTFTGLRIGVASARAFAQSLGLDVAPVSSLRALAHGALRARANADRDVLAVVDARRGEVFVAGYSAGDGEELLAPRALAPHRLGALLAPLATSGGGWLAVGDGAVRFRSDLLRGDVDLDMPEDSSLLHRIDGACICELALETIPVTVQAVAPDYLRRPDAELALEGVPR
jgi:tRNA threonylcarbamoyladenosine biosynthesis protein TsaB